MASRSMATARRTGPPPAAALMDELVEEILLRIPSDDPRSLARAAAVCKLWRRLIADPAFLLRRMSLHPAPPPPPMLGFFYRRDSTTRFMPTSSFRPPSGGTWRALDARHGLVLFLDETQAAPALVVSSPVTGEAAARRLPTPWDLVPFNLPWNAALLTSGGGGAFTIVLVGGDKYMRTTYTCACVYSSEDHQWSLTARAEKDCNLRPLRRGTLAGGGDKLYFREIGSWILEYDLGQRKFSSIPLPPECGGGRPSSFELMAVAEEEDGRRRLGFAVVRHFKLCLWSMDEPPIRYGRSRWTQRRVIGLRSVLPVAALSFSPWVVAVADGVGVVFVWAGGAGVFTVGLETGQVRKVSDAHIANVIPYVNPAVLQG